MEYILLAFILAYAISLVFKKNPSIPNSNSKREYPKTHYKCDYEKEAQAKREAARLKREKEAAEYIAKKQREYAEKIKREREEREKIAKEQREKILNHYHQNKEEYQFYADTHEINILIEAKKRGMYQNQNLTDFDVIEIIFDLMMKDPLWKYQYNNRNNRYYDPFEEYFKQKRQYQKNRERFYSNTNSNSNSNTNTPNKEGEYFKILGISPTQDFTAIKSAYKKQMKLNHPDKFNNAPENQRKKAEETSKKINEAYQYFEKKLAA